MSHLDERLRSGLREAGGGAAAPDLGALTDDIMRRRTRRDTVRRLQAGGLALGVVAVVAGVFLALARTDPEPTVLSTPSPSVVSPDQALQIAGVPFPVCHPMTIPGSFGDGLDTLWVFSEGGELDTECSSAERSRFVAVGSPTAVSFISEPSGVGENEASLWPYATPDIDGDGIDEIAIGIGGSRTEGYARIALFRVVSEGKGVTPVVLDCGPACRPAPWISIGSFVEGLDGAYCGPDGFVRWSAGEGRLIGTVWALDGDRLVQGSTVFDRSDTGTDYPPDGSQDLCGSSVTWPEDLSNYIYAQRESTGSPTVASDLEGEDIGIDTNVCSADRKGGLEIVPGGEREVAWVGYMVSDDGSCPKRNITDQDWIVAIDATGDGVADSMTDLPLDGCRYTDCWPLGAADLDGDGDGELIVTTGFTIQDQGYFAVEAGDGGFSITPILVASPGHEPAGVHGDAPLMTSSAGDAGYAAWIRCENYPVAPILVFTYVSSIVDSDQPEEWHEVKLQLQADGLFHVIDTTDLSLPPGDDPGLIRSEAPACGVDFTF